MIFAHLRIALASLTSTRVRTGLTTLGIIIGVTSITLVLALGEGAKQAISRQVVDLDQNIILIKPGRVDQRNAFNAYNPFSISATTTLTERDYKTVSSIKGTNATAPVMFINGSVKLEEREAEGVPILATTPSLVDVLKLKVRSGQFLDPTTKRETVVLGQRLALELLGTNQARGQEVIIKGTPHTVTGVLRDSGSPINIVGVDLDRSAFISLDDGKNFNQGVAQIQQIIVKTSKEVSVPDTAAEIDAALLKNHEDERDFSVLEGENAGQSANEFYNIIVGITAAVAGISLIVGGVGIMNVMLVSVTERTREIGIRKALGATDVQILAQFLIEALVMTIIGGVIGLALAYGAAFIIGSFFAIQPVFSWAIVAIAMGLATGVGLIFGLFPAYRASRKDPIVALRQYQ